MSTSVTAYLQTPGLERAVLPGGWLVGRLDIAVVEPFFALPQYAKQWTLADMKAANPDTRFLAYLNGATVRDESAHGSSTNTVFLPSIDVTTARDRGWLVEPKNPDRWKSGTAQSFRGTRYASYQDYDQVFLADIGQDSYRKAFTRHVQDVLGTASTSRHGAPKAYFDGVFLDDTNLSPQHGLDRTDLPEQLGHWDSDAAYGQDMIDFVTHVSGEVKKNVKGRDPVIAANLGADPWTEDVKQRALDLARARAGGKKVIDRALREFTTRWADGRQLIPPELVQSILEFGAALAQAGIPLDLGDVARPPGDPQHGPLGRELADWDKQQRLVQAASLLARSPEAKAQPTWQAVQVHEGRNQWDATDCAEDLGARVADLPKLPDAGEPTGKLSRQGSVLYRACEKGTLYANFGRESAKADDVEVPGLGVRLV